MGGDVKGSSQTLPPSFSVSSTRERLLEKTAKGRATRRKWEGLSLKWLYSERCVLELRSPFI